MVALVGARPPISTVCWFNSPEEAAAFRETHPDYEEDVIVFCPKCGLFHLSHPSWLASRPWEIPVERIDFATMTPVQPEAELLEGFVRIILPVGRCFDIVEELWTEAREIEPKCVILSRKATGKKPELITTAYKNAQPVGAIWTHIAGEPSERVGVYGNRLCVAVGNGDKV